MGTDIEYPQKFVMMEIVIPYQNVLMIVQETLQDGPVQVETH